MWLRCGCRVGGMLASTNVFRVSDSTPPSSTPSSVMRQIRGALDRLHVSISLGVSHPGNLVGARGVAKNLKRVRRHVVGEDGGGKTRMEKPEDRSRGRDGAIAERRYTTYFLEERWCSCSSYKLLVSRKT